VPLQKGRNNALKSVEVYEMSEWVGQNEYMVLPVDDPEDLATTLVWIFLRVSGNTVDPHALTNLTGIQPRRSELRGEYSDKLRRHRQTSVWEIALRLGSRDRVDTEIQRMLVTLEPHRQFLQSIADRDIVVDVHAVLGANPEWAEELSPQTLGRVAVLGARLVFEVTNAAAY
jgi:hypothetical protein